MKNFFYRKFGRTSKKMISLVLIAILAIGTFNITNISAASGNLINSNYGYVTTANPPSSRSNYILTSNTLTTSTVLLDNTYCTATDVGSNPKQDASGEDFSFKIQLTTYVYNESTGKYQKAGGGNPLWRYNADTSGNIYIAAKDGYSINWKKTSFTYDPQGSDPSITTLFTDGGKISLLEMSNAEGATFSLDIYIGGPAAVSNLLKTASGNGLGDRFFNIDLQATFSEESTPNVVDVVLVLDNSGSMPWLIETPTQISFSSLDTGKTDNSSYGWNYTYYILHSAGEYRPIAYLDNNAILGQPGYYDHTNYTGTVSNNGGWYTIEPNGTGQKGVLVNITSGTTVYTRENTDGSKLKTKLEKLNEVVTKFINDLAIQSPTSTVGIIMFAKNATKITVNGVAEMVDGSQASTLISSYNSQAPTLLTGGTDASKAFALVNGLMATSPNSTTANPRSKYVIYFTDGEDNTKSYTEVDALKSAGIKIFGVGLYGQSVANPIAAKTYVQNVSSGTEGGVTYYKEYSATEDLKFDEILSDIGTTVATGTVRDYIDPRFVLVSSTGIPLTAGSVITDSDGNSGVVKIDTDGTYYLEWANPYCGSDNTFRATITLKAKDDFIGGNAVTTNLSTSGVTSEGVLYPFPMPTVNVNYSNSTSTDQKTIFYGETMSASEVKAAVKNIVSDPRIDTIVDSLFSSGSAGIEYYYTGTSVPGNTDIDKFGTLTITLNPTTDFNTLSSITGTAGYTLNIVFTPITESIRRGVLLTEYSNRSFNNTFGTDIIAGSIFTGTYNINFVSGELKISKSIDSQYGNSLKPKYDQSFIYRIERYETQADADAGINVKDTFYEVISFSANEGVTSKTATITGLQEGYYKVIEETDWSWKYLTEDPVVAAQFIGRDNLSEVFYGVVPSEKTSIVAPGTVGLNSDRLADYTQDNTKGKKKDTVWFGDVAAAIFKKDED